MTFGSLDFTSIFPMSTKHGADTYHLFGHDLPMLEVIGFLLFIGAMGKSAQLFLHVWLPDAMEGPTPVSALIHAATMVTAGVFLMARMSPLMEYAPYALTFVTFIGASTAFFAATVGCVQNDIKRVIAYSTCSQLGYMFVAAGVGAYQVSIFHLITHAFFKALLFLSAGSVIHAMSDEQDMRRMGGLARLIPVTCGVMWIGNLALAGIPPFAGCVLQGRDHLGRVSGAQQHRHLRFRLHRARSVPDRVLFLAAAVHDLPWHLARRPPHVAARARVASGHAGAAAAAGHRRVPRRLAVATAGSSAKIRRISGTTPSSIGRATTSLPNFEHVPAAVEFAPLIVALAAASRWPGSCTSCGPTCRRRLAKHNSPGFTSSCSTNGISMNFTTGSSCGRISGWPANPGGSAMRTIIDGVPNGLAALAAEGSREAVKIQTGSLAAYAFVMLIGVVVLVGVFMFFR